MATEILNKYVVECDQVYKCRAQKLPTLCSHSLHISFTNPKITVLHVQKILMNMICTDMAGSY